MFKNGLYLLILIFLFSCSSKFNQYIKIGKNEQKRNGKWREEYPFDNGTLVAKGKYNKGEKIGTWKTTLGDKIYQKDKIKNNITKTKFYYPNGKLMQKGQSKLEVSDNESHWYYYGDWKFYNEKGELQYIKKYNNGKKIDSISFLK